MSGDNDVYSVISLFMSIHLPSVQDSELHVTVSDFTKNIYIF